MMNQHYAFWNDYYEKELMPNNVFDDRSRKRRNEVLINRTWRRGNRPILMQDQIVALKICYPGLTTGLGQTHISGQGTPGEAQTAAEIQMGFSLDPVTGLPVIPGTSVKGLLRSVFLWTPEIVRDELKEETGLNLTLNQIKALELDIFGSPHSYDPEAPGQETHFQGRDVFLDAYPVLPDGRGHLLGLDFITPHMSDDPAYQGLTGPNPNAFLKILPGVVILFRFRLKNSEIPVVDGDSLRLTAGKKRYFFMRLLKLFGIGAKTNTGYGLLDNPTDEDKAKMGNPICFLTDGEETPISPALHAAAKTVTRNRQRQDASTINVVYREITSEKDIQPDARLRGMVSGLKLGSVGVKLGRKEGLISMKNLNGFSISEMKTGRIVGVRVLKAGAMISLALEKLL